MNKNRNNNTTHIRVYPETKIKLEQAIREMQMIEKRTIKMPEVLKRTTTDEIINRLKIGSEERVKGLKK